MRRRVSISIVAATLALVGCGKAEELTPAAGQALPMRPAAAREQPTANDLLTPPTQARPHRIDEPLRRSEERKDDPFDLPPPGDPE